MGDGEEESTPLLLVHKDFDVIVNHQEENDFVLKRNSSRSKTNILRRIATFDDSDIDSIFSDLRSQIISMSPQKVSRNCPDPSARHITRKYQ